MSLRYTGEGNPFFGKEHTTNTLELLRIARVGKTWDDVMGKARADDLRQQFSMMFSGSGNPFYGRKHKLESCNLITLHHMNMSGSNNPMYGQGDKIRGDKNGSWKGGISNDPYEGTFTEQLKTEVRKRDKFTCKVCGENGFDVHHIDYDKLNSAMSNLVTLCHSCHMKTNFNRENWVRFFND